MITAGLKLPLPDLQRCRRIHRIDSVSTFHCARRGSPNLGGLPDWPVFAAWFEELTGEDWLAVEAIEKGHVKVSAIPPELMGPEKRTERVAWLIEQIPADERELLQQKRELRQLEAAAWLAESGDP
jgi:hypothetical protein